MRWHKMKVLSFFRCYDEQEGYTEDFFYIFCKYDEEIQSCYYWYYLTFIKNLFVKRTGWILLLLYLQERNGMICADWMGVV